MASEVLYTRSLIRRFFAYAIDSLFAGLTMVMVLLAIVFLIGEDVRLSSSPINLKSCQPASAPFTFEGKPVSTENFQTASVCTVWHYFVINDTQAIFVRQYKQAGSNSTWTEYIHIPVNARNEIVRPLYLDLLYWVILILAAAWFESSKFRATPGKLLLGLAVTSESRPAATFRQALIRNLLKTPWLLLGLYQLYNVTTWLTYENLIRDGKLDMPPGYWQQLTLGVWVSVAIVLLAIPLFAGLFLPWRKAGRALYDRLAGTYVIKTGAA